MARLKNVEGLLFEQDLLVRRQIGRKLGLSIIRNAGNLVGKCLGHELGSGSAFYAVRGKYFEFRIVRSVKASVRHEKDSILTHCVGEATDIGKQFFSARHIEFSAGQHEIGLHIHFPKDEVSRNHGSLPMKAESTINASTMTNSATGMRYA